MRFSQFVLYSFVEETLFCFDTLEPTCGVVEGVGYTSLH
jgi:hypothetical protein